LIAGGRLTGFVGTYLMLVMILLIARMPWLERAVGQDALVRWHRRIGGWPLVLIALHVVLITLGYAQLQKVGGLHQLWTFLTTYPDVLAAAAGFCLLILAGVTSIRYARRRLQYETWWVVHLYTYLALALAFAHQIVTGGAFIGHPLTRAIWIVLWSATAGVVIACRIVIPVVRNLRFRLRVVSVHQEARGVLAGLLRARAQPLGRFRRQFFQWRFLAQGLWWHAHPYSLSALPQPPFSGDGEGPWRPQCRTRATSPWDTCAHRGTLWSIHATCTHDGEGGADRAGVGITPLRALLEDLPASVDATVVVRASKPDDIVLRHELKELVRQRDGDYHEVVGSRHKIRFDERALRKLVPDIDGRDVYIADPVGSTRWSSRMRRSSASHVSTSTRSFLILTREGDVMRLQNPKTL